MDLAGEVFGRAVGVSAGRLKAAASHCRPTSVTSSGVTRIVLEPRRTRAVVSRPVAEPVEYGLVLERADFESLAATVLDAGRRLQQDQALGRIGEVDPVAVPAFTMAL